MGLNPSKGNMYKEVDYTWNTVKGACGHDCPYCYMKQWGPLKPARFDEGELGTDLGEGNTIFVGSSNDLFGPHVKNEWIQKTLKKCCQHDNKFLFQTKDPYRVLNWLAYSFPVNSVIGTTIETDRKNALMGNAPSIMDRVVHLLEISNAGFETFITIEPVMYFDGREFVDLIKMVRPRTVFIGADSGRNGLPEPSEEQVRRLVTQLRKYDWLEKLVCKPNLKRIYDYSKALEGE